MSLYAKLTQQEKQLKSLKVQASRLEAANRELRLREACLIGVLDPLAGVAVIHGLAPAGGESLQALVTEIGVPDQRAGRPCASPLMARALRRLEVDPARLARLCGMGRAERAAWMRSRVAPLGVLLQQCGAGMPPRAGEQGGPPEGPLAQLEGLVCELAEDAWAALSGDPCPRLQLLQVNLETMRPHPCPPQGWFQRLIDSLLLTAEQELTLLLSWRAGKERLQSLQRSYDDAAAQLTELQELGAEQELQLHLDVSSWRPHLPPRCAMGAHGLQGRWCSPADGGAGAPPLPAGLLSPSADASAAAAASSPSSSAASSSSTLAGPALGASEACALEPAMAALVLPASSPAAGFALPRQDVLAPGSGCAQRRHLEARLDGIVGRMQFCAATQALVAFHVLSASQLAHLHVLSFPVQPDMLSLFEALEQRHQDIGRGSGGGGGGAHSAAALR